jgi:hypothetical protein
MFDFISRAIDQRKSVLVFHMHRFYDDNIEFLK